MEPQDFQFGIVEFILYVKDQQASADWYSRLFQKKPDLHVQGMTEFLLNPNCKLGLMPITGIEKIFNEQLTSPDRAIGIPRCELYLYVKELDQMVQHALDLGVRLISPLENREWGDRVCYFADPEAHIIAFAEKCKSI